MRQPHETEESVEVARENKVAFVCPGQGSQYVGMGRDLYEHVAAARRVFDTASQILGFNLARLCREGPKEELENPVNVQPAIVTNSLAAYEATRAVNPGLQPDFVAGHSLGQISAAAVSGALSIEDAILLARKRGEATQEAMTHEQGAMAALIGISREVAEELCRRAGVFLANHNSPIQVVISGSMQNLERARELAEEYGVRKIIRLAISGVPFHSPLARGAEEKFKEAKNSVRFQAPKIHFVPNETGFPSLSMETIIDSIFGGLTGPVEWVASVLSMRKAGVGVMFEFGGSRDGVLAGLIRRINPEIKTKVINSVPSLQLSLSES